MLFLAVKHLLSRKKQTILIVLGIMIGTTGYVAISGMVKGFQSFLIAQLINNDAHIKIMAREEPVSEKEIRESLYTQEESINWIVPPAGRKGNKHIEYAQGWFDKLNADPLVAAYTPSLVAQVIFRRGSETHVGQITGTIPSQLARITNINDNMTQGKFEDIGQSGNRMVIGDGLMEKLGARLNDNVLISVGIGSAQPFKIVGTFHFGLPQIDDHSAYGALGDVQTINSTPSRISTISVKLIDINQAAAIAVKWAASSRDKIQSWEEANTQFLSAFKVQDGMRYLVTIAILIVAGFGIYNVLTILVNQKKQEIAILRSIGFDSGDITKLFLIQGIALGITGGVMGMTTGFLICKYVGSIQLYPANVAAGGHLPFSYAPSIYFTGFTLAFISSVIASILPARAAGKLTPIDIIRQDAE